MESKKLILKQVVEHYLKNRPETRDSDLKLTQLVWETYGFIAPKETAFTLLIMLSRRSIPQFDSISRWRRRLQQMHPEYRGKLWDKRHGLQENAKAELGYNI